MIKMGKDDGTGVFPMHERWENRMYIVLYYRDDGSEMNVFGGVFDNWKTPVDMLFERGYTVVKYDDEDQILISKPNGSHIKAYARIKQMAINGCTLAGYFSD